MLDAPLSAAGREFGGYTGFNEGFGFLDPLMDMRGWRGCSNSGDSKRFLHKTAAAQMRKRTVTLDIPRGCARHLYLCANCNSRISNGDHSQFILEKRYSSASAQNNPTENTTKITSILPMGSHSMSLFSSLFTDTGSVFNARGALTAARITNAAYMASRPR